MNLYKSYRVLGIKGTEDTNLIKRAFIKVAQKYHPDKNLNDSKSVEKFIDARIAYENILNHRNKQ